MHFTISFLLYFNTIPVIII
ncbi:hypothetical protein ACMD2_06453 [Ananas comosus]|uniref:Uncharacterized protein n=1 Tax=Ananas comosus TaxID=4615 RepID=A0A199UQ52_ANACO|nr:hypothetical protein ACMD2_06453 [Ananas comosus]